MTTPPHGALTRFAARRDHLDAGNLLRSLTEVINRVPEGINLGQGVCDLDSPPPLVRGAIEAIQADRQTYTPYSGLPELRTEIARKLRDFNGLAELEADGVAVTLGASGAFFATIQTLCEPGDEVVLFEPFYSYHRTALLLCGVRPICVPLAPDGRLDPATLRAALGPKTRAIVVNTPGNPSGKVFDRLELEAIASAIADHEAFVVTDEVYEHMVYDGVPHISPATIPGLANRTLTISSFSKTFSITGWRIGYVAGPPSTIDAIGRVCDQVHVCAPRPMQRAVERALRELPASFYADLRSDYEQRRNRFCDALEVAGFQFERPSGAYYVLADYRDVLGDVDPHRAALDLIESAGINGVPGHVFHSSPDGVRTIRFHFAVQSDVLTEACRRIVGLRA